MNFKRLIVILVILVFVIGCSSAPSKKVTKSSDKSNVSPSKSPLAKPPLAKPSVKSPASSITDSFKKFVSGSPDYFETLEALEDAEFFVVFKTSSVGSMDLSYNGNDIKIKSGSSSFDFEGEGAKIKVTGSRIELTDASGSRTLPINLGNLSDFSTTTIYKKGKRWRVDRFGDITIYDFSARTVINCGRNYDISTWENSCKKMPFSTPDFSSVPGISAKDGALATKLLRSSDITYMTQMGFIIPPYVKKELRAEMLMGAPPPRMLPSQTVLGIETVCFDLGGGKAVSTWCFDPKTGVLMYENVGPLPSDKEFSSGDTKMIIRAGSGGSSGIALAYGYVVDNAVFTPPYPGKI